MLSRHSSLRGEIHVWTGTSWGERTRRAWLSPEVQSRSCPRAQTPAACVGVLGWLRPMVEQSHPAKSTSSASDLLMKAWIWAQENRVRSRNSPQEHPVPSIHLENRAVKLYKPRGECKSTRWFVKVCWILFTLQSVKTTWRVLHRIAKHPAHGKLSQRNPGRSCHSACCRALAPQKG